MNRTIEGVPSARYYAPQCSPDNYEEIVSLLPEELALPDLIDLQGLEQEQAAAALGVSRKTVLRDIHENVAKSLVHSFMVKPLRSGDAFAGKRGYAGAVMQPSVERKQELTAPPSRGVPVIRCRMMLAMNSPRAAGRKRYQS